MKLINIIRVVVEIAIFGTVLYLCMNYIIS